MSQPNEESRTGPSPTRRSIFSVKLHSPTVTSSFSQADTILTSRMHCAANTGGRARQSWRNSITGFRDMTRFLADETHQSTAHRPDSVAGSSTHEAVSPKPGAASGVPIIELLASPVAGPDEPRSFFDSDSESDGEPILSRASSVRAQRPQLVQHNSNGSGRSLRVCSVPPAPSSSHGLPLSKAQQAVGSSPNTLHGLSFRPQRASPNDTRPGPSIGKAEQFLGIPLKNLANLTPTGEEENSMESDGGPADALEALTANALDGVFTTALAPALSSRLGLSQTANSNIELANTPARTETLSILPSPIRGFGTLAVPQRHVLAQAITVDSETGDSFCQPEASAMDTPRSNPVQDYDDSRLHRVISAPPLPLRHPHRKVTIQPLDLEAAGEHRLRQSVVSTPYPTLAGSLAVDAISPLSAVASTKLSQTLPPPAEERDRFPSPARPEVLYLKFAVARHPSMNSIVQVKVEDRSTYDDEALFKVLRKSYSQTLSGLAQYLATARALRGVTFTDPMFETASFVRHLHSPRAGRKRKTWLTWLREHQVKPKASSTNVSEMGVSFSIPASTTGMPLFKTQKTYPQLTLHFEFSLVRIALAVFGIMTMSSLAAIFWVLFGVPGVNRHDLVMPLEKWQVDAQGRVLTGLVLGVLVALLSTLGVAGWVAASWLLL